MAGRFVAIAHEEGQGELVGKVAHELCFALPCFGLEPNEGSLFFAGALPCVVQVGQFGRAADKVVVVGGGMCPFAPLAQHLLQ